LRGVLRLVTRVSSSALTAISESEQRYGVAIMANGKRRDGLANAIERILRDDMAGHILPFDSAAARAYATIAAARLSAGKPIAQVDCQIAAIALAHNASVVTRNTPDLKGWGIDLVNPWAAEWAPLRFNKPSPNLPITRLTRPSFSMPFSPPSATRRGVVAEGPLCPGGSS
jgi:toxin FitB